MNRETFLQTDLAKTLQKIGELLSEVEIPYCVVGGLAVALWGEPRATRDIDLLLYFTPREKDNFFDLLAAHGFKKDTQWEHYNPSIKEMQTRLRYEGVVIDFMEPRDTFQKGAIERAKKQTLLNFSLFFPKPEDLILMKLAVGRPRDIEDALSIFMRQDKVLDQKYLFDNAVKLRVDEELQYLISRIDLNRR